LSFVPHAIRFVAQPDSAMAQVMAAFVDVSRRPIEGPVGVEELLVHVLDQPAAQAALQPLNIPMDDIRSDAMVALMEWAEQTRLDGEVTTEGSDEFPARTGDFEAVVGQAILAVQEYAPPRAVDLFDLLIAIASLPREESAASRVLHEHGLSARRMIAWRGKNRKPNERPPASPLETPSPSAPPILRRPSELYDLRRDDRVWHDRHNLVTESLRLLSGQRRPGLLLVGAPAAGKATLAAELARRLKAGTAPAALKGSGILALDFNVLLAGCSVRGELEHRVQQLIHRLETRCPAGSVILWVGDLGRCLALSRQGHDVLGLLQSAVRTNVLRLMASATPDQVHRAQEQDPHVLSLFVPLEVPAPTTADLQAIARLSLPAYAAHHGVTYPEALLPLSARLVERHLPHQPPIASLLQALDEAGAHAVTRGQPVVEERDVHAALARQAHLPPEAIGGTESQRLGEIEAHLQRHIVAQDHGIAAIMGTLRRSAVGLGEGGKTKPLGAFFFAGPTGVGKTEIAKRLAEGMGVPLVRLDMSEYREAHTTSRLLGAPPGYVGYHQQGLLAQPLQKNPHSVILLDEFEKAAPEIHALFLQVLDRGTLTDGQGHPVDFRQCLLIASSNVGATDAARPSVGFVPDAHEADDRRLKALKATFLPELLNRFDHILQFNALAPADMAGVVDRNLARLALQAKERGHEIAFDRTLRTWLAEAGYDATYGARPLQRLIDQQVTAALADALLAHGGTLRARLRYARGKVQVRPAA
jgi:ATP-dependent Clp protease ATP-binding subunit ClpA